MTTLKIFAAREYPEGAMRNCIIFTHSRLELVRLIGFINRAGFDSRYLKEKSIRQAPNFAWFAVWRISNRKPEAKLFKEEYTRAKKICAGIISPYRSESAKRMGFIAKLYQMEAAKLSSKRQAMPERVAGYKKDQTEQA